MALEGLNNIDLSGVGGYIHYTYDNTPSYIPSIIGALALLILFVVFSGILLSLFSESKTRIYSNKLVDLYVASTIRKFAKEDGLNLEEEYKLFVSELKKEKLETKGLRKTVEGELAEKVIAKQEEKVIKK